MKVFRGHGIEKVRITGGEPLVRRQLEKLIAMLAQEPGLDLTLTTNGSLLKQKAQALKDAGLNRVTVSLDSMDDAVFKRMNDVDFPVARVLEGIEEADRVGLKPIKVNMVVKRGTNDQSVVDMARHFKGSGHILRFIEFMDVGHTNGWGMGQVVPSRELVTRINAVFPIEPADPNYAGEVAERWRYKDGSGEVGFISSVTRHFARTVRARAFPRKVRSILVCSPPREPICATSFAMVPATRNVATAVARVWRARTDRYSEIRTADTVKLRKVEMYLHRRLMVSQ